MGLLNRHLPTLLFVLILALGTTGVFALGAHDEAATDGLDTAENAQTQGDVQIENTPDVDPDSGAQHGEDVSTTAQDGDAEDGCAFGLAIADLASGYGNDGESPVAEQAHENCEDDGGDVGSLENGDDASGFGQDTAETAQEFEEGDGEEFGRDTAENARDGAGADEQGDAGSQQDDARDRGDDARGDAGR